jgi:MFS family permease
MAALNVSSIVIALPDIFRGIHLDPLAAGNFTYLLWMLMGYMLIIAALVVTLGRIGDMFGRVRMYNLGFVVFTLAAVALSFTWSNGPAGALEIIILRMVQAIGAALLMANSAAIITDAFPHDQRGMALGINAIAALAGQFAGLVLGGLVAAIDWRWVFLINVPIGLLGTVWAYWQLREQGERHAAHIDWLGNITFAAGLALLLIGITYAIQPYHGANMSWGRPLVLEMMAAGCLLLVAFVFVEQRVAEPMFNLSLFRIRAFTAGNLAGLFSSIGRGGMQFMLIMWLQGIWLPLHGYSFARTPLWAGLYLLPMTAGFVVAGPVSGWLSDRYGARPFATSGMVLAAGTFGLMMALPADFSYASFAVIIFLNGASFGLFAAPNTASIMNSVPARHRGVASGMRATFQNTGTPMSIGIYFSIMIASLVGSVPATMLSKLSAHHVTAAIASPLSKLPPTGYLFAAFLGMNPLQRLLGTHVLATLPPPDAHALVGHRFFPGLIATPFKQGLSSVLIFSIAMCLISAAASWLRGGKFVHEEAITGHGAAHLAESAEAAADDGLLGPGAPPPVDWPAHGSDSA